MTIKPIPDGYSTLTPYLIVSDAAAALDFYQRAFGARERLRLAAPGGKIGHAEIEINDCVIMLADEFPEMDCKSPLTYGGSPISLHLYVQDVDTVFAQALAAGSTVQRPLENKFYGDRSGSVTDPFGHVWHIATHIEDVSHEEVRRRAAVMEQSSGGK